MLCRLVTACPVTELPSPRPPRPPALYIVDCDCRDVKFLMWDRQSWDSSDK